MKKAHCPVARLHPHPPVSRVLWLLVLPALLLPVLLLSILLAPGCASPEGSKSGTAERSAGQADWKLVLALEGEDHEAALRSMDIFLQEDETEPEPFAITGEGVRLAGSIPVAGHVGYGEKFDHLLGQRIAILPTGYDEDGDFDSSIELEDESCSVQGGWLQVNEVTGRRAGAEGDRTLHGTIELRTERGVLRGEIAVHAITWG